MRKKQNFLSPGPNPLGGAAPRFPSQPASQPAQLRQTNAFQKKIAKTLSVFNILRVNVICGGLAAFGLHVGIALAGQPAGRTAGRPRRGKQMLSKKKVPKR